MAQNSIIRPFKTDIYYNRLDSNLNIGITHTLTNTLNKIQDGILFEDKKETSFVLKGKKPYSDNRIGFSRFRFSNFSIIISPIEIDQKFVLTDKQRHFSIISNKFVPPDSGVKLIDFFSYYVTVAMLSYYIPALRHHGEITECPFDNNPSPANLRKILKRGHLCQICEGKISSFKQKEELDFSFFESIGKIQNAIAQKYIQEDKQIKTGQARQSHIVDLQYAKDHPDNPDNMQQSVEFTTESHIGKPVEPDRTASTGKYNIANDDENPVDSLGYEAYADAFADIIMDRDTKTPFTIGICGQWGRGKTVLLNYIKKRIEQKSDNDKNKCQCIKFNAWKYSEAKQIWAEFYTNIINDIESKLTIRQRFQFKKYVFKKANPFIFNIVKWFSILLIILLTMSLLGLCAIAILDIPSELIITLSNIIFSKILIWGGIPTAAIGIWKFFCLLSKQVFIKSRIPTFKDALGVQHEIFRYIGFISDWLQENAPNRIVVIIDDIDRCAPNQIMQMFESIKQFLDSENFVFLLGLDAKIAIKAIGNHYEFMEDNKHEKECLGKLYLDKIIQIPFQLPQPDSNLLNRLCKDILGDYIETADEKINQGLDTENGDKPSAHKKEKATDDIGANSNQQTDKDATPRKAEKEKDDKVKLLPYEIDTIKEILKIENINFSPRLLKRFINIYLIARHIYIGARLGKNNESEAPNPSFIKWLALSVLYPHETAALYKWLQANNWENPLGDPKIASYKPVFYDDGIQRQGYFNDIEDLERIDSPFYRLNKLRLDEFGKIYLDMEIEAKSLFGKEKILNLFNLVLD